MLILLNIVCTASLKMNEIEKRKDQNIPGILYTDTSSYFLTSGPVVVPCEVRPRGMKIKEEKGLIRGAHFP